MRVLVIILLTYFLIKYLFRIFAPFLIKRFADRMQDRFNQQFDQQSQDYSQNNKEGDVTIETNTSSNKKKKNDIGEFIDFEEPYRLSTEI